jgi:hypothetical protein
MSDSEYVPTPQALRELAAKAREPGPNPMQALAQFFDDVADEMDALREWIVMADNRLECKDCLQCVDVARSYLQEALKPFEKVTH